MSYMCLMFHPLIISLFPRNKDGRHQPLISAIRFGGTSLKKNGNDIKGAAPLPFVLRAGLWGRSTAKRSNAGLHVHIMCHRTKAQAWSKSLMQNLCLYARFSGWKNQYCWLDALKWQSALWLTLKAQGDWGAAFVAQQIDCIPVLIIACPPFISFCWVYFDSDYHCGGLKQLYHYKKSKTVDCWRP